ncbi:hypothetical protein, partial [Sulfurimonas sp.]|uniref:hypothetical protein n=1 Tax=Sulfurimonas sp. TaxID=2022749 RepID=UPI003D1233F9
MKKLLLLCFVFVNFVFAHSYDDVLLKAQAAIFPKIILLDKKLDNKLINGKIVYTIVYDASDVLTAKSIKEFIDKKFDGHLGVYKYTINLVEVDNFSVETPTSAVYILNLQKDIQKIADIANVKGIISFSYDINNLKKGLMFSLVIEKSTVLYLTKENLYTKKVVFVDALLQMVRFIEKNDYVYEDQRLYNDIFDVKVFYAKTSNMVK